MVKNALKNVDDSFQPKGQVTHRFSYARPRNGSRRSGVIANYVLKVRKVIEFKAHLCR